MPGQAGHENVISGCRRSERPKQLIKLLPMQLLRVARGEPPTLRGAGLRG